MHQTKNVIELQIVRHFFDGICFFGFGQLTSSDLKKKYNIKTCSNDIFIYFCIGFFNDYYLIPIMKLNNSHS